MIRALFSAASGMSAQQMNVDNIAHNLANANTVGFKMRRTQFQDLLYQSFIQPGAAASCFAKGLIRSVMAWVSVSCATIARMSDTYCSTL